ncbi:ROK family protein [Pannonibacter tanglangensis]|nr:MULTISPECIES: ROK family protein [unclassified Pannonibacter]
MARIDLGRATQLSPATITAITSDMLDEGLIVGIDAEEPKAPLARGRPRSLLAIDGGAANVISVRISVSRIDLAMADFTGRIFHSRKVHYDALTANAGTFPATLTDAVRSFVVEAGVEPASVLEVGVASQGIVDTNRGVVVWSPAFAGRDIPVVAPLQETFSARVTLSNDTNMITEALHWSDPARYSGTFAVVMVDYGVGMGLFLDDHLFVGASGAAAEIGHANHIPGGARCRCGRQGCLEAYLADYALLRMTQGLPEDTDPATMAVTAQTFEDLHDRAEAGDQQVIAVLEKAGVALGYGIARLLALIDPARVVLTGAGIRAFPFMEGAMHRALDAALVEDLRRSLKVDVVPWNEDFIRRGLIAQAMRRLDETLVLSTRRGR